MGRKRQEGKKSSIRVAFTGGGTAGHVFPGLAVLNGLEEKGSYEFVWIGSSKGVEAVLVSKVQVPFIGIPTGKFRRELSLKNFTDLFKVFAGIFLSLYHLKRLKPLLLFSKGGFVSVPPVLAAAILRIPILSHESDLDPGLATRIALPFAKKVCVPFEESVAKYPTRYRGKIVVTGNPVRKSIGSGIPPVGQRLLKLKDARPVLLVLGGSQGAIEINRLIWSCLPELLKTFQVVHQVGSINEISKELSEYSQSPGYTARGFFAEELPHVLSVATVVVSRAGAGTLWELASLCKPMLLIPLRGKATRGDQVRNAELFESRGWAKALYDTPIHKDRFLHEILELAEERTREKFYTQLKMFQAKGATEKVLKVLEEQIGEIQCSGMV